jgi:hypothetical protein
MNTQYALIDTKTNTTIDRRYGGYPALTLCATRLNEKEGWSRFRVVWISG